MFTILAIETVSAPSQPSGADSGLKATSYPFTTGGSTSSLGHTVQYKFDWNDGSDSGWLAEGTTQASHSWAANGTYDVRAMARCVTHTTIESLWSATHAITISDSGTLGKYNSPAQQKILPEVIWAAATGGGTWMSEVQVTDISGGSQVSVYYNTSAGRRGPFVLWNNSGGALRSMKYSNMLRDHRRPGQRRFHLLRNGRDGGVRHPGCRSRAAGDGADVERQLFKDIPGLLGARFQHRRYQPGDDRSQFDQQQHLPLDRRHVQSDRRRADNGAAAAQCRQHPDRQYDHQDPEWVRIHRLQSLQRRGSRLSGQFL